jgi:hypothetical protein
VLVFRVVLVNTARPDGAFLFVVWFIHWKHMIRPFLFIDKQKRKLSWLRSYYLFFILGAKIIIPYPGADLEGACGACATPKIRNKSGNCRRIHIWINEHTQRVFTMCMNSLLQVTS